jgi:Lectin C-type domain
MSRFFASTLLILVGATGYALAQGDPVTPKYNLANQHTYVLSPAGMTWQNARSYSRTLGGYLVAINSLGEQMYVNQFADAPAYWIGLSDAASEGTFQWDSGELVTFTGFCIGDPNNSGNADYVAIVPSFAGDPGCWSDEISPSPNGTSPTQAIIELAHGDRVNFDSTALTCSASPFPTPLGATTHPEGISWNGASAGTNREPIVTSISEDGMPVSGTKYVRVIGDGSLTVPLGGPLPRPVPPTVNEVRIAIPPGTRGVSFAWDLIAGEAPFEAGFNDGMDVSVVDGAGVLITTVAYADMLYAPGINSTGFFCNQHPGVHILPAGPQTASKALPPLPFPSYLSIVCWNGGDSSFPSTAHFDAIQFWGSGPFRLSLTAPAGPGSIQVQNSGGKPGNSYWTVATLNQGSFPNGWLFGLDISAGEVLNEVMSGVPFSGTLNGSGISIFNVPAGLPSGFHIYAVSLQFQGGAPLGTQFLEASAPEHFVTL